MLKNKVACDFVGFNELFEAIQFNSMTYYGNFITYMFT